MRDVKRQYRQKARAEKTRLTRERIVEAAVKLHEVVGPARTSLAAVAREAGVSRPTLYSHFPDETSLFRACTRHWMSHDPPPDPTDWLEIEDPNDRVVTALSEIYSHYERNEQMIGNVFRDMHLVDSMRSYNLPLVEGSFAAMTEILASAYGDEAGLAVRRKAVVSVAISFDTWKTLVRVEELSDDQAVHLMARVVECVGEQKSDTR